MAISICLPVYNGERFLAQAIESVLAQSFTDFELIIVDDRSTDGSFELARKFAAKDARVRLLKNDSNLGLFQNYNRCLTEARGEYIKPFAQDDVLDPTMLEEMLAVFQAQPAVALVSTGKRWLGASGETLKVLRQFQASTAVPGRDVIRYNLIQLTNWVGEPSTVMFRAALKGTGFDTTLFHYGDIDYWFRIVENRQYYYLDKVLCSFRRHGQSATSTNLSGMYFALDILKMGQKYCSYLEEIGETPEHFQKRALEVIALNMDHLVNEEGLTSAGCLSARPARMPVDEAASFKELSFYSARYITDLLGQISGLQHQMEDQKKYYEQQIADIHASSSWKLTAPLRNFCKSRSGV